MYCPNSECPDAQDGERAEFRDDVAVCPFCATALVSYLEPDPTVVGEEPPPKPKIADDEEMEIVLETIDLTEAAIVRSLLDGAGMPYLTRGDDQYDAFQGTLRGTFFNPTGRPITFLVPARMAKDARELLKESELPDEG